MKLYIVSERIDPSSERRTYQYFDDLNDALNFFAERIRLGKDARLSFIKTFQVRGRSSVPEYDVTLARLWSFKHPVADKMLDTAEWDLEVLGTPPSDIAHLFLEDGVREDNDPDGLSPADFGPHLKGSNSIE